MALVEFRGAARCITGEPAVRASLRGQQHNACAFHHTAGRPLRPGTALHLGRSESGTVSTRTRLPGGGEARVYTGNLGPGDDGEILFANSQGTVHVKWDRVSKSG